MRPAYLLRRYGSSATSGSRSSSLFAFFRALLLSSVCQGNLGQSLPSIPPAWSTTFPYEPCVSDPSQSLFSAALNSYTNVTASQTSFCLTLVARSPIGCNSTSRCCDTGVNKVKIAARWGCRASVQYVLINGKKSSAFSFYGDQNSFILKITPLNLYNSVMVNGTTVCVVLGNPCSTLELFPTISEVVQYSLYDVKKDNYECCPTGAVSILPPQPPPPLFTSPPPPSPSPPSPPSPHPPVPPAPHPPKFPSPNPPATSAQFPSPLSPSASSPLPDITAADRQQPPTPTPPFPSSPVKVTSKPSRRKHRQPRSPSASPSPPPPSPSPPPSPFPPSPPSPPPPPSATKTPPSRRRSRKASPKVRMV